MRYFVYKDSQVLGPFAREELDQAGGLRPETLVCPESHAGRSDLDWRALEQVAELAGVATLPPSSLGLLETPLDLGSSVLERLELESLGVPMEDREPDWLRDLFSDADAKRRWGLDLAPAGGAELPEDQRRVAEMGAQLKALQARIAELEAEQARLLGGKPAAPRPSAAAPVDAAAMPPAPARPEAGPAAEGPKFSLRADEAAPAMRFGPSKSFSRSPAPLASDAPPPAGALPPTAAEPSASPFDAAPLAPPAPDAPAAGGDPPTADTAAAPAEPSAPAPRFALRQQASGGGMTIRFGAKRSFKSVAKQERAAPAESPFNAPPPGLAGFSAPPPLTPAPAPTLTPPPALTPAPTLAPPTLSPAPPTLSPAPSLAPPPMPAPTLSHFPTAPPPGQVAPSVLPAFTPPPQTVGPGPIPGLSPSGGLPPMPSLSPSPMMSPGVPPLEPPPIPTGLGGGPATMSPAPMTPVPMAPATLVPGSGAAAAAAAVPISPLPPPPQTQDVLARLAKPAPAPETKPPQPRGPNKKLFAGLGVAVLLLGGVLFYFLRSPRDLKTMTSMGADQKPIGMEVPDNAPQALPKPPQAAQPAGLPPQAAQTSQAFPPQAGQAPQAAPPQAAPAPPTPAPDASNDAIALVKSYPLDGDRGNVAQWLQFQFMANPDDGNQEQWTAGGVDATTYLVQYQLRPGPKSAIKDTVSYVFEADVQRQTVLGKNPAARQLLAGEPVEPRKKKPAKKAHKAKKPKVHHKAAPPAPKEVPLAPLPTDAELLPPADNDSGFSNDTINPPL